MTRATGAHLLARTLRAHGIDRIFGLCGDHVNGLLDACAQEGLAFVGTRHESGATHMADAWARVTGRPGVSVVTGGPGHSNSLTGIGAAWLAGSPLIAISGSAPSNRTDMGVPQDIDQVAMVQPITKWARCVHRPERLGWYAAEAYRRALSGRPGPVHLSVPHDVLEAQLDPRLTICTPKTRVPAAASPDGVDQVVALLAQAERPALIAGGGVYWSRAWEALQQVVEHTGVPCFTTRMGRGCLPDEHPLCFGDASVTNNPLARDLGKADLVLIVGRPIDSGLAYGELFSESATLVHVGTASAQLGAHRAHALVLSSDERAFLDQLVHAIGALEPARFASWVQELRTHQVALEATIVAPTGPQVHPRQVVEALREALPADATLVFDGGDFTQFCRAGLRARRPGHWLRHGPYGSIGASIPFAVAAKLARPHSPVVAMIGDGAMGFHSWELHTAIRQGLSLVIVVGNNGVWGMERAIQHAHYGRTVGTELGALRYDRIVAAMGGHGERVASAEQVRPALERALERSTVSCIDIAIEPVPGPLTESKLTRRAR